MSNTITLGEVLKGKATIIKNKEFFPSKTYIEPFIDKMSKLTDDFRIQVKLPDQITKERDLEDLTFNRVWIQAVLPEKYCIEDHDEVIGLVYGIDVRKPVAKLYRGHLNRACTNLCVFNPQWLNCQDIVPGEPINYAAIKNLLEDTSDFLVNINKLKSTYIDRNDRMRYLGEWVDRALRDSQDYGFGKVKITKTMPIEAYEQLYIDQDSQYYIPEGYDPTLYDVYNSFTQIITDDSKDLMNKFEKTMIVNKLLGVYK